jgi:hypothetical protein
MRPFSLDEAVRHGLLVQKKPKGEFKKYAVKSAGPVKFLFRRKEEIKGNKPVICWNCKKPGHHQVDCKDPKVFDEKKVKLDCAGGNLKFLTVSLPEYDRRVKGLVDLGSQVTLIDERFLRNLGIQDQVNKSLMKRWIIRARST